MSNRSSIAEAIALIVKEEIKVAVKSSEEKKEDLLEKIMVEADNPKKSEEIELVELDTENIDDEGDVVIDVDYSEEFSFETESKPIDYLELFYGGITNNVVSNPYTTEDHQVSVTVLSDAENQQITHKEAEQTLIKIQYAAVTKNFEQVSFKDRKKFANWVRFNPVLMRMFESVHGMTNNVDYDVLF